MASLCECGRHSTGGCIVGGHPICDQHAWPGQVEVQRSSFDQWIGPQWVWHLPAVDVPEIEIAHDAMVAEAKRIEAEDKLICTRHAFERISQVALHAARALGPLPDGVELIDSIANGNLFQTRGRTTALAAREAVSKQLLEDPGLRVAFTAHILQVCGVAPFLRVVHRTREQSTHENAHPDSIDYTDYFALADGGLTARRTIKDAKAGIFRGPQTHTETFAADWTSDLIWRGWRTIGGNLGRIDVVSPGEEIGPPRVG